ncbi:hypothetical protein OIV83_001396 [Microbotryomycetes sp. JL201]|nr:hypothetical protein OIV83_001396 [Microbotryomycetes sp. JL201]
MFYLLSRLVSTVAGAIYPAYASYKAIKANDVSQLEVWLMFWVVMGIVMTFESTLEWLVTWVPFYYEIKTLVILWLTLPQIQGSTYIYVAHVHPFLTEHEDEIDQAIADGKDRAKQAGLAWLGRGIAKGKELLGGAVAPAAGPEAIQQPNPGPTSGPGTAGLFNLAGNYLKQYGPAAAAFAAGHKLLQPMNGRSASVREQRPSGSRSNQQQNQMRSLGLGHSPSEPNLPSAVRASGSSLLSRAEVRRRRAELEAELAALSSETSTILSSPPSSASNRSVSSSVPPPSYSGPRQSQPRSISAGSYPASLSAGHSGDRRTPSPNSVDGTPRDPVAARIERSFVGGVGFEEIRAEDVGDFPPAVESRRLSTGVGGGSWWRWGASQQQQSPAATSAGKKNA